MSSSTVILYKSPHPRKPVTHQGSMVLRRAVPSIAYANGERVCIIFRNLEHAGVRIKRSATCTAHATRLTRACSRCLCQAMSLYRKCGGRACSKFERPEISGSGVSIYTRIRITNEHVTHLVLSRSLHVLAIYGFVVVVGVLVVVGAAITANTIPDDLEILSRGATLP